MKKFTKSQVTVIAALSAALILLTAGILIERALSGAFSAPPGAETPPTGAEAVYHKNRDARISLSPKLELETNLGGSGDETLCDAYCLGDTLYIFGNTTSADFDMENGSQAFMAVLTAYGRTEAFYFFGEDNAPLFRAIPAEGGFLLALNGQKPRLVLVDYAGGVLHSAPAGLAATQDRIVDLKLLDGYYAAVVEHRANPLARPQLRVTRYARDLTVSYEREIRSAFSLTYVDCFFIGDAFTLFFNANSDIACYAGAAVGNKTALEPKLTFIDDRKTPEYQAAGVMPTAGGWAMAVVFRGKDGGENGAGVKCLNAAFVTETEQYIGLADPLAGQMYYYDSMYYTYFSAENSRSMTAFSADFTVKRRVPEFDDVTAVTDIRLSDSYALFGGVRGGKAAVIGAGGAFSAAAGAGAEHNVRVLPGEKGLYLICESRLKGGDVGGNFGGSDIWIARIR
ncbi:MAG: hypothetical protein LBH24_00720 [Clostridiales bacterium]|jgi:hypothetical protein|nr:hypothetical protein [Clostridiales bacterium]